MGDGAEIQLAHWSGRGKPILAVHGLTANCRCWDAVAHALIPMHQVLAMDLRGRGRSEHPPSGYDIDHHCRDIRALLSGLGLTSVTLMGHSLGAAIAIAFAANHPELVERIVLIDGGGKLSQEQTAKVLNGIKPSLERLGKIYPSFSAYLEAMRRAPFLQPWSPALETYFQYEVETVEGGVRSRVQPAAIQEELLKLQEFDISKIYPLIKCPVLILRATEGMLAQDDILLPEDVLQKMLLELPSARRIDLEGANHYTIIFHRNEVRDRAILAFLE